MRAQLLSCIWLFATPQTVAHQVPLLMGFHKQEYWSGLPFLLPGSLSDPGIEPVSPAFQVNSLPLSHGEAQLSLWIYLSIKITIQAQTLYNITQLHGTGGWIILFGPDSSTGENVSSMNTRSMSLFFIKKWSTHHPVPNFKKYIHYLLNE